MLENTNILQFVRLSGLPAALFVIIAIGIASRAIHSFTDQLGQRFTERRLLLQQAGTMIRFLVYFAGIGVAVALAFNLTREMWLAVGGTVAVALGFAFKDLAASVVAGLTILFDRPFQVGDRVTFEGHYGEITQIGLRSVRLVSLDDNLITIPNNRFLVEAVSSGNAGALDMLIQMDFHIGIDQDLSRAKEIVRDAITSSRYTYLGKPWSVLVNEVIEDGYFALRLRAKAYVLDVHYEKDFETDVTERIHGAFRDHAIGPPALLHRGP